MLRCAGSVRNPYIAMPMLLISRSEKKAVVQPDWNRSE
jgi:hypothetical protein